MLATGNESRGIDERGSLVARSGRSWDRSRESQRCVLGCQRRVNERSRTGQHGVPSPAHDNPRILSNRRTSHHRPTRAVTSNKEPAVLKLITWIVTGVLLFLVISGLLARFFSVENVERDDEVALIEAQVKGDANGIVEKLAGCRASPACVASARANASRLRRPGPVKILSLKSQNAHSLTSSTGTTRLAWTVIGKLPVVQCVRVRRSGNLLEGFSVTLLALSAPIPNEADC